MSSTICGARPSDGSSSSSSLRLGHQGAADRQLLLLAAGERAGRLVGALRQDREQGLHFLARLRSGGGRIAARGGAEPQILRHRQRREDPPAFRHHGEAAAHDLLGVAAERSA